MRGTTVAAVAAEAGISPGTIYVSLKGKRGLLEGVIEATIMVPVGVAVLRAGVWTGWRRWMPALCPGYLLAASPLFGAPGALGLPGVTGWEPAGWAWRPR